MVRLSTAMLRMAVNGTPSAPMGPRCGSVSSAALKNTTRGLDASISGTWSGCICAQARMVLMVTVPFTRPVSSSQRPTDL